MIGQTFWCGINGGQSCETIRKVGVRLDECLQSGLEVERNMLNHPGVLGRRPEGTVVPAIPDSDQGEHLQHDTLDTSTSARIEPSPRRTTRVT